ncbi:MAG: SurA N-terminal domain-containing protein [Proteobacteria bacterium]|nr:SurA N-terminal domain-containing protein [Pseudomonadota bacterium]
MLQNIRQNIQGTAAKIVVGLIVVSFAFFGIESILLSGGGSGIAEVNGEQIYPEEVQQLVNTEKRRLISMMGDNINPAILDDQRLSAQALQRIINRKLQMQSAQEMELTASEREIGALIGGMEQFQIDGQFSPDMYKSLLSNAGFSPSSFKAGLREDMILNQLRSGLAGSDFATSAELALTAKVSGELRDIRYLTIPLLSFRSEIEVGEEEIKQYYDEKGAEFLSAESLLLDYIELSIDDFRQPVKESVLLEQYELEKDSYAYATENRVSHILFEARADENNEALQARVVLAVTALTEGEDFAELAKASSDDIGSASVGGDLGFSSGDAFPAEMEEAIAELEVGGVSELVETDAGLHLIKLTERRDGKTPTLDDLRLELTERIQSDDASAELLRTTENLRDYVFNAEDLGGPAEEFGLTVKRSEAITRSQREGLFANATLLAAAFSEDVLESGHNSEVIELSSSHYVVLRVNKHSPAEVKALELVRGEIVERITRSAALDAVAVEATRALQALHNGESVEAFANQNSYEWQVELAATRGNPLVPPAVLQRAFELPAPKEGMSAYEYVVTPQGDTQVFELVRVTKGDYALMADQEKQGLEQQLSGEFSGLVDVEYQNALRERAEITVM